MPYEVKITGHQAKESLKSATCVLPISVGQEYHMGSIFRETLLQIQETFSCVIIVVADTLQKNSLILKGCPIDEAEQRALKNGDQWLADNREVISSLPEGFCTVMRWNEWLEQPSYRVKKREIDEKFIQDASFTDSVQAAAIEYRKLHHQKAKAAMRRNIDSGSLCREVILEEGAVIGLWIERGYHYMAYPIEHSPASKQIFSCLKSMYHANLELLNIEIQNKPSAVQITEAPQSELTSEQKERIQELEEMITQPFLTQLFSMSRGHLLDNDALKIALLLGIQEKVQLACTNLVEKMSTRQLANEGLSKKKKDVSNAASHNVSVLTPTQTFFPGISGKDDGENPVSEPITSLNTPS